MQHSPAFSQSLQAARTFSLHHGINYISSHLICCAAIEHSPAEQAFLSDEDKPVFLQQLFAEILGMQKIAPGNGDEVPLSQDAQVMMRLAAQYMHAFGEEAIDIPHYILAVLSCNTKATLLLKERGWVFKNYLEWLTAKSGIEVHFPDQLYPATDFIPRRHKMKWHKRMLDRKARQAEGRQYLQDSLNLSQYNDHERAYQAAVWAAKDAVRDATYYTIRINAAVKTTRYAEALKTVAEAKKKGIPAAHYYLNEAYCHMQQGRYDKCIAICEAQLADTPHPLDTYGMIGRALAKDRKHREAIAWFDRILAAQPANAFALNHKGYSLFELGHTDEAMNMIHASLRTDKGNSLAYRNLAVIGQHIGQHEAARAVAVKAILFGYREDYGNDLDKFLSGAPVLQTVMQAQQ